MAKSTPSDSNASAPREPAHSAPVRLRRNAGPALALIVGLGLSIGLYFQARHWETENARAEFARRAANVHHAVDDGVKDYLGIVRSIRNLSVASGEADRALGNAASPHPADAARGWMWFKTVYRQLVDDSRARLPGVRALGWIGHTSADGRADVERNGKFMVSPSFQLQEMNNDGGLQTAAERDEYYPVLYLEPIEENRFILGLDLGPIRKAREPLLRARDTGAIAATDSINWIKSITGSTGILLVAPVYDTQVELTTAEARREHLESFVLGVFLIEDMLGGAVNGLREDGVHYAVYVNQRAIQEHAPIYASMDDPAALAAMKRSAQETGLRQSHDIEVADKVWTLVCYATLELLAQYHTWVPGGVLCAGLAFSVLVSGFWWRSAGRTRRVEQLVAQRTLALRSSNEELRREIAVRKEAEENNRALEKQLLQKQKLESVGELAGGVAHDFNNLLIAILGYSELGLEDESRLSPEVRECLNEIRRAGERASGLTKQLLAFSRRQIMNPAAVDLDAVITGLEPMLRRLLPENIRLDIVPHGGLLGVRGDIGQLEQVIVNLVVNARDAMEDGGRLAIATDYVELAPADLNGNPWARPGAFVRLTVSDTGVGMAPGVQERVFDPFFSTKDDNGGTGLGLSVAFGIVKQHEGFIDVTSAPGEGSSFYVYLPVTNETPAPETVPEAPPARNGAETILLVEDEDQVRRLARRILELSGYTVLEAHDGDAGLQTFKRHERGIDLVLTDVVMPNMGGKQLALKIREINAAVPVLFTSGYSRDGIHTNFILQDGLDFIQKPYTTESLRKKIREMLDKAPAPADSPPA